MIVDAYEYIGDPLYHADPRAWIWRNKLNSAFEFESLCGKVVGVRFGEADGPGSVGCKWGHTPESRLGNRIGTFNTETGELTLDSEKRFEGVPGVPEGWWLVRIGLPKQGETYVGDSEMKPVVAVHDFTHSVRAIIERITPNIEVGKWYQLKDGTVRKVTEVHPDYVRYNDGVTSGKAYIVREVQVISAGEVQ